MGLIRAYAINQVWVDLGMSIHQSIEYCFPNPHGLGRDFKREPLDCWTSFNVLTNAGVKDLLLDALPVNCVRFLD